MHEVKKVYLVILVSSIFLLLLGCNTSVEYADIEDQEINNLLKEEYPYYDHLRVLTKKTFRENIIVVFSYNIDKRRFVDYRFIANKKGKPELLGGGGGLAETNLKDPRPLSVSSSGGTGKDYEPYFITYGEIFDDRIKYIRIKYSDGLEVTEEITDPGYIFIREEKIEGLQTIEAFDGELKVVYRVP